MFGGAEFLLAGAIIGGGGGAATKSHLDARELEEVIKIFKDVFPKEDLDKLVPASSRPTMLESTLPFGTHEHARSAIGVIEAYQEHRQKKEKTMASQIVQTVTRQTGIMDARMRVFEEMKQWLASVTDHQQLDAKMIGCRLDYCRRLLMYPELFSSSSASKAFVDSHGLTFTATLAQLSVILEKLLVASIKDSRTTAMLMQRIMDIGRNVVVQQLSVFYYTAVNTAAFGPAGPPGDAVSLSLWQGPNESTKNDFLQILDAFRKTPHFRNISEQTGETLPGQDFIEVLSQLRESWKGDAVDADSGLILDFRDARKAHFRCQFLAIFEALDRTVFFLTSMIPYHSMASKVGDVATCHLHDGLNFVLQELEGAVLQLRQARMEVMRAAKLDMQRIARTMASAQGFQINWMQALRNISESDLDELHGDLLKAFCELRNASSSARLFDLQSAAKEGLGRLADAIESPDFQRRVAPQNRNALGGIAQSTRNLAIDNGPRAIGPN